MLNLKKKEKKITNYVQNTIASQIKDYQIIIANKQKIGCLLLEKYQDGVLLNEKIDIL